MTKPHSPALPVALTIAGLDPSGGAGIIADIRTFAYFGCFPTAAITSLTFQNTTGVFGAVHQSAETVRRQVIPILDDFPVDCVKTGMLATSEVIDEVARLFRETALPAPVIDPVMRSTSGHDLINDDAVSCLISGLLPLARVVTPNIPEAERLTGLSIVDEDGMRKAAATIRGLGARAVLIKGGHLRRELEGGRHVAKPGESKLGRQAIDVLDDEGTVRVFSEELVGGAEFHGSGCTLAAALAACLGKGMSLERAVETAKKFVTEAIRRAPQLGHGTRPLHLAPYLGRNP